MRRPAHVYRAERLALLLVRDPGQVNDAMAPGERIPQPAFVGYRRMNECHPGQEAHRPIVAVAAPGHEHDSMPAGCQPCGQRPTHEPRPTGDGDLQRTSLPRVRLLTDCGPHTTVTNSVKVVAIRS